MKKSKIKPAVACIISAVLCLLSASGCGDSTSDFGKLESYAFKSDLVKLSVMEDIAKIDMITPGLDTFSFKTLLWNIKKDELLGEVSFDEGAWVTGQTENGFYAVDTTKKELLVYNRVGECVKKWTVANASDVFFTALLSPCENFFAYFNPKTCEFVVNDFKNNHETRLPIGDGVSAIIDYKDGQFYAVTIKSELIAVDVAKKEWRFALIDSHLKLFSADFCLGETETNFLLANEETCLYTPINAADEVIIGLTKQGFCTEVVKDDKYQVNCYDLKNQSRAKFISDTPVQSVCFTNDGKALAVVGTSIKNEHSVKAFVPEKVSEIAVFDEDKIYESGSNVDKPETNICDNAVIIKNVPIISQFPEYPTGCESVSTVMALRYAGFDISVEKFVTDFLPKSRDFYIEGGKNYGPSPYEFFIGNPKTEASYGCMSPVIENAVINYLGDSAQVKRTDGQSVDELCRSYIDNNVPVIFWATINMRETNPINSWYLGDGKRFTWPGNEHCMLLVGYDEESYYFNDPYSGALVSFTKELTADRYAELGKQSLVILNKHE